MPNSAQAQLRNPSACSNRMIDMMTDGMVMAYTFSDMMCMPTMGMCDQMMGEFFSMVLDSPSLTMEFMDCAEANPELVGTMIKVIDSNPELLYKMGHIMGISCAFSYKLAVMAKEFENLRDFFFARMNDYLYQNLSIALLCDPAYIAQEMGEVIQLGAQRHIWPGSPLFLVMDNLGESSQQADANDLANERLLLAFFRDVSAAQSFMGALGQLDPQISQTMLNIFFLGQQVLYTGQIVEHPNQAFYQSYAVMRGLAEGVLPNYDMSLPPDPQSSNPANQLIGMMMPLLMAEDAAGLSPYGSAFVSAVRSAAEVYCMPQAFDLMKFFSTIFPPEMLANLPEASILAPAPRDEYSGQPLGPFTCPNPNCSAENLEPCVDEVSCSAAALNWCEDECQIDACPEVPVPVCAADSLDNCDNQERCTDAGLTWCGGRCQIEACPQAAVCSVTSPENCTDQPNCEFNHLYWCDGLCQFYACAENADSANVAGQNTDTSANPYSDQQAGCTALQRNHAASLAFLLLLMGLFARRQRR